jgi:hypothetical protein
MHRSEINRALAKAIAYKQCGNDRKATAWAAELVRLLGQAQIIDIMAANTSTELLRD